MAMKPPYTITEKAADYLAKIVEAVTRLEYGTEFNRDIRLHRENRMRTIHSSLAIEGNPLTLGEVTAVLEGKIIAGRQAEIKEVKNAYEAYDLVMTFDPFAIEDFLKAHKLMTDGLVEESGKFRGGDVGVFNGGVAVHIGRVLSLCPGSWRICLSGRKGLNCTPYSKARLFIMKLKPSTRFQMATGVWGGCGKRFSLPNGTRYLLGYRWSRPYTKTGRCTIAPLKAQGKRTIQACLLNFRFP